MSINKKHVKTFWNRRFLLYELVKKGIKLKYRRSYLGILWSMLEPILTTIVLTIVFGTLFGNNDKEFPLYILCGRLVYSFFATGTKTASGSKWKGAYCQMETRERRTPGGDRRAESRQSAVSGRTCVCKKGTELCRHCQT